MCNISIKNCRTDLPELQKVGEYSYTYGNAEKKEQINNKNSIGDMISKSSSVLRSIGNKAKNRGDDFDQVALISDDDVDDEEDSSRENTKPVKKIKGKNKKKYKPKLGRNLSDPTSNSIAFSRHEAEQMDGLKLQDEKMDPKEGVLQNLKKKHGMFNNSSSSP